MIPSYNTCVVSSLLTSSSTGSKTNTDDDKNNNIIWFHKSEYVLELPNAQRDDDVWQDRKLHTSRPRTARAFSVYRFAKYGREAVLLHMQRLGHACLLRKAGISTRSSIESARSSGAVVLKHKSVMVLKGGFGLGHAHSSLIGVKKVLNLIPIASRSSPCCLTTC